MNTGRSNNLSLKYHTLHYPVAEMQGFYKSEFVTKTHFLFIYFDWKIQKCQHIIEISIQWTIPENHWYNVGDMNGSSSTDLINDLTEDDWIQDTTNSWIYINQLKIPSPLTGYDYLVGYQVRIELICRSLHFDSSQLWFYLK